MPPFLLIQRAAPLALLLAITACGGPARPGQPAGARPAGGPSGRTAPRDGAPATDPTQPSAQASAAAEGHPAGSRAGTPAGTAPVTEAECHALLSHVISLANAAHEPGAAPELAPTDEQIADIHAQLAPQFMPPCLALDRATFACELSARSKDALLACSSPP